MPNEPSDFLGPWNLAEVLEEEFARLDAVEPDDGSAPWTITAEDIASAEAAQKRIEELELRERCWPWPSAYQMLLAEALARKGHAWNVVSQLSQVLPGADRKFNGPPATDASAADVLNAALDVPPHRLADVCLRFLQHDQARGLWKSLGDLPDEDDTAVRHRANRAMLEAAFDGILRPARDRAYARLFARVQRRDPGGVKRWALCLSGGGIRSASFGLGVIQGLARHRALEYFDYLSTVSGGGYIGSWLSAWMARDGRQQVLAQLGRPHPADALRSEPGPVHHLRAYTRYLAPAGTMMSADMWTLVATVLRNLVLNWFVLMPVLAVALLVPLFSLAFLAHRPANLRGGCVLAFALLSFAGAVIGVKYVHERRRLSRDPTTSSGATSAAPAKLQDRTDFLWWCYLPLVLSTCLVSTLWIWFGCADSPLHTIVPTRLQWFDPRIAPFAAFAMAAHLAGWLASQPWRRPARPRAARGDTETRSRGGEWRSMRLLRQGAAIALTGAAMGPAVGLASLAICWINARILPHLPGYDLTLAAATGVANAVDVYPLALDTVLYVPAFLLGLALAGFLYVGWTSGARSDGEREWSARYSAWLLIGATVWVAFAGAVLLSGPIITSAGSFVGSALTAGASGGVAALLGFGGKNGKATPGGASAMLGNLARRWGLGLAAFVAVASVLITLAYLDTLLLAQAPSLGIRNAILANLVAAVVMLGVGAGASRRIDVNRFSLHAMYRMRLVRAYLGASRPTGTRRPNPFTGFDARDNLPMHELEDTQQGDERPTLHVLNMALNVTSERGVVMRDRKARSFTVSPLHAGSWSLGYRRTSHPYGTPAPADHDAWAGYYGGDHGISLGTAMAISGAAASPNMGFHSSPTVAFLMTLFNARLGWWLGNPGWRGARTFHRSMVHSFVSPIYRELLGIASDHSPFVNLTDGGHFENLGLYEMVLRRVPLILAVDASCDPAFTFADLGNAVERIREDFGVEIRFDDRRFAIRRPGDASGQPPAAHYALGTIGYSAAFTDAADGLVIYLKPTLTGNEPRDVLAYGATSPSFPHESTAEQFFSEAQFESYRKLGEHTANELFPREWSGKTLADWRGRLTALRDGDTG